MSGDPIHKLYPGLSDSELHHVRENLDYYLALAWEIYQESHASQPDALDGRLVPGQDSGERSIPQTN